MPVPAGPNYPGSTPIEYTMTYPFMEFVQNLAGRLQPAATRKESMSYGWTRREFLNRTAGSAAALALAAPARGALALNVGEPGLQGRFVTHSRSYASIRSR